MAAILASTITAFEGSVIRPVSEAFVDCAWAAVNETKRRKASVAARSISHTSKRTWGHERTLNSAVWSISKGDLPIPKRVMCPTRLGDLLGSNRKVKFTCE